MEDIQAIYFSMTSALQMLNPEDTLDSLLVLEEFKAAFQGLLDFEDVTQQTADHQTSSSPSAADTELLTVPNLMPLVTTIENPTQTEEFVRSAVKQSKNMYVYEKMEEELDQILAVETQDSEPENFDLPLNVPIGHMSDMHEMMSPVTNLPDMSLVNFQNQTAFVPIHNPMQAEISATHHSEILDHHNSTDQVRLRHEKNLENNTFSSKQILD